MELFRVTRELLLDCANSGANRVMVDFGAEMAKLRSSASYSIFDEWVEKTSAI